MGQFDKQDAPSAGDQKKKVILVIGLAAALAVVLGLQFGKPSPRTADANPSAGTPDPSTPAPEAQSRSVSDVLRELEKDPTANLLNNENPQDPAFLVAPRDPFLISEHLRASLTKIPDAVPVKVTDAAPHVVPLTPQSANIDGLKLQGIFLEHQKLAAFINGNIVHAGMVVGNVRIYDIQQDRIIVQNPSFPTGPRTEILLKAPLNK